AATETLWFELKEELGVKAEVGDIFSVDSHTYTLYDGNLRHVILLTYETSIKDDQPKTIGCSEIKWVMSNELDNLDFVDADKKITRKIT
ncbi:MAG: NUDIX domain-containing protein, partial [Candidatus Altiarchaeota archaeon]|nr:NUDIX domain-containing protein [Candidatus Altiarchaeota archaeon]